MRRPGRDVRVRKWRIGAGERRYADGAMDLDFRICDRARLARDPRFDGRFFIAVVSTGIYCRPICPSPHASRANVRYFRSGAEAVAAGFRPCLRCRPEAAPGTPAWSGTSATVSRALRLIHEGAFTTPSVAELSRRLGVSARHLDRLFTSHLGASPTAVVRTWRLNAARELISDTDLPMSVVAQAAGFGSVRRFNDSIRRLYGRTPTALRRTRSGPARARDGEYVFRIAYRPPFDWEWMLGRLASGAIPGVEEASAGVYRRTISRDGRHGVIEVRHDEDGQALEARIRFAEPGALLPLMSRVRDLFDVATDAPVIAEHLGRDPMLAPLLRRRPAPRVPGAWDSFELAVVSILDREAGGAGRELAGRIARQLGEP
ncbi:MAG TPA: AlkA N-terminal domain-containing protein, partial [Thermoanaerobaculia bacterium]|nr:AlkA N-terminal domain-containing protein [Thermoanaerobaculia bacterium]